jgi:hypothetical protein
VKQRLPEKRDEPKERTLGEPAGGFTCGDDVGLGGSRVDSVLSPEAGSAWPPVATAATRCSRSLVLFLKSLRQGGMQHLRSPPRSGVLKHSPTLSLPVGDFRFSLKKKKKRTGFGLP